MPDLRRTLPLVTSFCLSVALLLSLQTFAPAAWAQELKASDKLKWYRGNMHTHSLWSDGDDYMEQVAKWYSDNGYQFVVFTEHDILANKERWIDTEKNKGGRLAFEKLQKQSPEGWVETREKNGRQEVRLKKFSEVCERFNRPGNFLLLQGQEITSSLGKIPVHFNATNLAEFFPPRQGDTIAEIIQNNVDAFAAIRDRSKRPMMIHVNHPNFGQAITAEDLMQIRGAHFFELYNGHPFVKNSGTKTNASSERLWDIANTWRATEFRLPLLYGLATDDCHDYHKTVTAAAEPGRGWVFVLSEDLSAEKLIEAMEKGRFYASNGVRLKQIVLTASELRVEVEPEKAVKYVVEFVGTRLGFDPKHKPILGRDGKPIRATERYSADVGAVLAKVEGNRASYKFKGDEIYVRARITSTRPHPNPAESGDFETAWTQPQLGPGAKQKTKK